MIVTGVGSRQTPLAILDEMTEIARQLAERDHWLRSGHANGADYAFEQGAGKRCVVYLPWKGYNKNLLMLGKPVVPEVTERTRELVYELHPAPDRLSGGGWALMLRNVNQVLGLKLDNPSQYLVCWTKDGGPTGGTGLAIRLAVKHKIPVYNMYYPERNTADKVLAEIL